ncbi:MAG: cadherin-like beta sandwich domain-containing protein [Clostridium sp.]|uniref:N-acetylmuramoyl-L-alanine amidase family protein n=1 Tax=Clostridium sp. TaxID=1506 RepID=UPI0025BF1966|nr:cadherin-like beta sandwich domain-containing protein [Clostridium sp.]MCE5221764.1 cadherin-like beta sandwich domain-containing protein [Clostridium sp.]
MNKKTKIMLACLLTTSSLSVFSPINFSILTTKAYAEASTYSLADNGELKSLDVKTTNGDSLELCDDYGGYKKYLTDEKTYYLTLDGESDGVKIYGKVEGKDYVAKVFESDRKYATPHDMGENISLENGKTTLYIRTYTSKEALERAVDNEDITNCDKTYKLNINKSSANGADDIYLERLTLDSGNIRINFHMDTISYNISVDEDQEDIEIKAQPEDEDYTVKIAGFKVSDDDNYKKDLHLKEGLNVIKINVMDINDKIRTYTLNIIRGKASEGQSIIQSNVNENSNIKMNQWVQVNGKWQYNDSTGNVLKNCWYYDRNYNKTYYLKEDGTMAINWLYISGNWYYLGQDGGMKTGWQNINGEWYYLQSNGVMAKNTKINGYKLGNDGAWVK